MSAAAAFVVVAFLALCLLGVLVVAFEDAIADRIRHGRRARSHRCSSAEAERL